eukprot:234142_1
MSIILFSPLSNINTLQCKTQYKNTKIQNNMASKNKNNKNSSKSKKSTKKNSMDGTRQQLMKQKKSRPSTNSKSKTPRTPPKYSNGKSKATGSKSISYATSPNPTPKGTVLRFDQPLKRKRKKK